MIRQCRLLWMIALLIPILVGGQCWGGLFGIFLFFVLPLLFVLFMRNRDQVMRWLPSNIWSLGAVIAMVCLCAGIGYGIRF